MSLFDGNAQLQPPYHEAVVLDDSAAQARNTYRDGGTLQLNVVINTVRTQVYRDRRISSSTRGKWFDRYPGHEGATELPAELAAHLDKLLLEQV